LSPEFEVKVGLKQGDAISPFLFNLALEKGIRDVTERHYMDLNKNMNILVYADVVIILDNTQLEIIQTMEKLI